MLQIRQATENDLPFIYSSWLKSNRNSGIGKDLLNEIYFDEHKQIIGRRFSQGAIYVAHPENEPDVLMGFISHHQGYLDYVYVKQNFRKMKVASTLIKLFFPDFGSKITKVTHTPKNSKDAQVKFKLYYNPYHLLK